MESVYPKLVTLEERFSICHDRGHRFRAGSKEEARNYHTDWNSKRAVG